MERVVLITAASRRLGAAMAKALAAEGHRVAIHHRSSAQEAETVREEIEQEGGAARVFQAELTSIEAGEQLAQQIVAEFGSLDTLINNQGLFTERKFDELRTADWDAGLASTVSAAFFATRGALPYIRQTEHGRIVNIGDSMCGRVGFTEPALSYYVGKVGIWMMTQTLATTEAPHHISVNVISPGMLQDSVGRPPVSDMPMGRFGTYEDIIGPLKFLLQPENDHITGTNLMTSGGWNIAPVFSSILDMHGMGRVKD